MLKVKVDVSEFDDQFQLSPEHWIAFERSKNLASGVPLCDLVEIAKKTTSPNGEKNLVLDTGNARYGLLDLGIGPADEKKRTSNKKILHEGDVIISRLRPYLRQVAYIPKGTFELLGIEDLYCSTEFFVLRPISDDSISFLVPWLLSDPVQLMLGEAATGGHHPRFDVELLIGSAVAPAMVSPKISHQYENLFRRHLEGQCRLSEMLSQTPI